jgi:hypothetical protein
MWVNSTTLKLRFDVGTFVTILTGIPVNGEFYKVNSLGFLDNLSAPDDPVAVINDIVDVFCPKGLSPTQKLILKSILTGGLPDFEWTIQYNEYLADTGNPTFSDPVRIKVEQVLYRIFQMPEFHVM